MPGWELIGEAEKEELLKIFTESDGVLFAHGFNDKRSNIFRVREFEKRVKEKLDIDYCLACTSGTMAQYIAMKAMGIGPGDEVITQSFTFVATVETILALGATPVIVDIDETYNMDYKELEKAITKNTKLIVPVHMLGNQCRMNEIMKIARQYKIPVLEDACEALGGELDGKMLGTIGDVGVFSLDFGKTITTGEGGLIVTNDPALEKYSREFHDHGHESNKKVPRGNDTRTIPGLNFRISEMQGAVGLAQIEKLDFIVQKNRKNKKKLKEGIIGQNKIKFRTIVDEDGDLADTLIFALNDKLLCQKFLKHYSELGYSTKNIPEAYDWHFAGKWNHMFTNVPRYKNTWQTEWKKSDDLLSRSISIPILVNSSDDYISKHIDDINSIISTL